MTCNRVIIIDGGEIKATDTPANLTQQMRAAGRIELELKADFKTAQQALNSLDKVKKVMGEELDDGWLQFTVWIDSGTDARERIAALAARNNWPLRSLFRQVATLEDVFVELTPLPNSGRCTLTPGAVKRTCSMRSRRWSSSSVRAVRRRGSR